MGTLPRFRFPDESAPNDAITARIRAVEFDDLDSMTTSVRERGSMVDETLDAEPTAVRPVAGRLVLTRRREIDLRRAKHDAPVEDVVLELRAAAAGRMPHVRELPSSELSDASGPREEVHDVDVSELMFDRQVPARPVWNVHQAAPRPTQVTALISPRPHSRFVVTAAVATFLGALCALGVGLLAWRLGLLSF